MPANNYQYNPHTAPPVAPKNYSNSIAILSCILAVLVIIAAIVCVAYVKSNTEDSPAADRSTAITKEDEEPQSSSAENISTAEKEEEPQKEKYTNASVDPQFKATHTAHSASDIVKRVYLSAPEDSVDASPYYNTVQDSKFNYKISYPRHFYQDRVLMGSARNQYKSSDGSAYLRISAAFNGGSVTPADISNEFIKTYGGEVTYNPVQSNWFAISSNDGYNCHYAYFRITGDIIKGFEFHFTDYTQNIDFYSKYIDYIYESFNDI